MWPCWNRTIPDGQSRSSSSRKRLRKTPSETSHFSPECKNASGEIFILFYRFPRPARPSNRRFSSRYSSFVISRYSPVFKDPSSRFMIRTRFKVFTRYPSASHIRRIWRFKPWVKIMRKDFSPVCSAVQGLSQCRESLLPFSCALKTTP